ncbi:MAG: hypothetical protein ACETVS_00325 [Dehalococcoidales bacterium]
MSKKMKVFVAVLAATLLLTVGGAATVMADDEATSTSNATSTNGLLARVAEILDIPQEDLVNAFQQARQEMREEAFISYLDKAVEDGLITQEEADEIREWWEQRPEGMQHLTPRHFLGKALQNRHMWSAQRGMGEEAFGQAANRIMERWQNRLETQNCQFSRDRIRQAMRFQQASCPRGWQLPGTPELAD